MTPLLPENWQLPAEIRDRLGTEVGRQRAMVHDEHLLLVLHAPPAHDDNERAGRFFWREPTGTWHGHGSHSVHAHIEDFVTAVDQLEDREQRADSSAEYFEILSDIVPTRRAARHLHQTLQSAREQLPEVLELIPFRDAAGSLERSVDLVSAEAQNGLDHRLAHTAETLARTSHDMAVAAHRLNHLAAIFFPIATVAAVFGMNLPSGLETYNIPTFFWVVVGVSIALGWILKTIVMSKPTPRTLTS